MPFRDQHKKCLNGRGFSFKCVCFFNTSKLMPLMAVCLDLQKQLHGTAYNLQRPDRDM